MRSELFEGTVYKYMALRHVDGGLKGLSKHVTCHYNTLLKYWKDPDLIPIGVFNQIMDTLKVPYEERWELLKK